MLSRLTDDGEREKANAEAGMWRHDEEEVAVVTRASRPCWYRSHGQDARVTD